MAYVLHPTTTATFTDQALRRQHLPVYCCPGHGLSCLSPQTSCCLGAIPDLAKSEISSPARLPGNVRRTSRTQATRSGDLRPAQAPAPFRYPGEVELNHSEYMVTLDKPIGLTLAPDPVTGQIIVQNIKEGSPAANSQMIQVGDIVKMCSAVLGEDMWQAIDIRRIRWAINNRASKIKLILERSRRPAGLPTWYSKGQVGLAGSERDVLQLPVSFTNTTQEEIPQEATAPGRNMMVAFHRSVLSPPQHVPTKTGAAAVARAVRLEALREDLAEARREPELDMAALQGQSLSRNLPPVEREASRGAAGHMGPSAAAASALLEAPSRNGGSAGGSTGSRPEEIAAGGVSVNGSTSTSLQVPSMQVGPPLARRGGRSPTARKVTPVLPWLLMSSSRLDTRDLTAIASVRGLGAMLELGLNLQNSHLTVRGADASAPVGSGAEVNVSALLANVLPAGGSPGSAVPGDSSRGSQGGGSNSSSEVRVRHFINAAAAVQRLAIRRAYGSVHRSSPSSCAVLLHCTEPGMESEVAGLIAGWLHWYNRMPLQEAILSAEIAMGCSVDQALLETATEALVSSAEERQNKVVLTWKYGGLSASIAGDVVGGWNARMPLLRCKNPLGCKGDTARGNFFVELTGLRPGVYFYKYIVDGTWTVDPTMPKVLDASGNWNNLLEVHERPPITTSRERLAMARWQAANLAYEKKMAVVRNMS